MSAPAEVVVGTPGAERPRHHLLALVVENKAGVLVRIAGLFSRRGFNIFSLAVAPTQDPALSRISIVVDAESAPLQQILDQLGKLINVLEITELHPDDAREAELLLATLKRDSARDSGLRALVDGSGGSVIDESPGALTVMVAGLPDDLDVFEEAVRPFGIAALQRTGRVALPKLGTRP